MATLSLKMSSKTTVVITYTVLNNPGTWGIRLDSAKVTHTEGTSGKWNWTVKVGLNGSNDNAGSTTKGDVARDWYNKVTMDLNNRAASVLYSGTTDTTATFTTAKGVTNTTVSLGAKQFLISKANGGSTWSAPYLTFMVYLTTQTPEYYVRVSSSAQTIPAKTRYAVTVNYNGSGAANATCYAYYNEQATLPATPTRTGYAFKRYNTNTSDTGTGYAASQKVTLTSNFTVYAIWNPKISYDANGGTGAPSTQTKTFGTPLTLSSTVPTMPDFAFQTWNTNVLGSGTSYRPGASYTSNAAATLYAQWTRTYSDPALTINSVQRVDATTHDADDMGTSIAVAFSWTVFDTPSGTNHPVSVVVGCNGVSVTLTTLTGLTGTATAYVDANCDTDQQYVVTVTLTDEGGASRSATAEGVVTTPYYPLDIRQGGMGVAIGGPSAEDALDIFMPTKILPRSTSATETPLAVNDGTDDVFTVEWDGTMDAAGEVKGVASQALMPVGSAAASCATHMAVRNGNQVTLYVIGLELTSALANGSATGTTLTVPAGYRPPYVSYAGIAVAGSNVGGSYARVGTNGLVTIRNQSGASMATTTSIAFTLTYVA